MKRVQELEAILLRVETGLAVALVLLMLGLASYNVVYRNVLVPLQTRWAHSGPTPEESAPPEEAPAANDGGGAKGKVEPDKPSGDGFAGDFGAVDDDEGDDYVTKPFSPREIVARIKAVLRRGRADAAPIKSSFGPLSVDLARHEALIDGRPVPLASQEWALLETLLGNQGLVLSRQQLLDSAWGSDWIGDPRTVDVHVRQLRRKLGDDLPLATVRGVGYRLG